MAIHPHGTSARYRQSCRCNLCVLVHENPVRRQPDPRQVPTGPARDHLLALRASGWSVKDLATVSGYSTQTLRNIAEGRTKTTSEYTVQDILSIPLKAAA